MVCCMWLADYLLWVLLEECSDDGDSSQPGALQAAALHHCRARSVLGQRLVDPGLDQGSLLPLCFVHGELAGSPQTTSHLAKLQRCRNAPPTQNPNGESHD